MTIRRLRSSLTNNRVIKRVTEIASSIDRKTLSQDKKKRVAFRRTLIESLEVRQLLAAGPRLIGVQPNNSDLIDNGVIRHVAPKELTFRFDDAQIIDAATAGGIRVSRAGGDGSFSLPSVSSDLGSNGSVDFQFTSKSASDALTLQFTHSNLGPAGSPTFSVSGNVVNVVLNSNPAGLISAQGFVDAINSSPLLSNRMSAKINGGLATTRLGGGSSATYSPVVMRANNDVIVQPGAIVIGDSPNENEVTFRFAENLPDDLYRLEIFGFDDANLGIRGLRNTSGDLFVPSTANTRQDTIEFRLDLGAKITGVVPQPVVRNAAGQLEQKRDTIIVYFDNDKLLVGNDASGNPLLESVENPHFYQLIYTADTVRNTDDLPPFYPVSVKYNASANTATLVFNDDLHALAGPTAPASSFRLRIGTRESSPVTPSVSEATATAIIDMNSDGAAKIRFTSRQLGEQGSGTRVEFTNSMTGGLPEVSVAGNVITVDLRSANTTMAQVVTALESNAASSALIRTTLEPGSNANYVVGNRPINYSATLYGVGSSFDTSMNLGVIGSGNVPMTSLILSSNIDAEVHLLDRLGAIDDVGQRLVPEVFENHINPAFGGDNFAGIRTLYYNFRSNYANVGGVNAITEKHKERVREALALWASNLGVQFIETPNSGITFALGEMSVLEQSSLPVARSQNFGVRIDPTYQSSLVVFSASNTWEDNYGEDLTRSAAASIGLALGLSNAGNLDPGSLMNFDSTFITFPPGADRNFEPVFPGNQDILHGQYIHRPESSDIDLYRFEIDFGPDGSSRMGALVAETFAERGVSSSPLNTRLALYKETQATATSTLNLGQAVQVEFTAVKPGKLGNNLQIIVTRSPRGEGVEPLVQVFPNAIAIELNSTPGSETTLAGFLEAIDNNLAARELVKVHLKAGDPAMLLGNRDITYSPIVLKGGNVELISQNDDYFSDDSLIRMNLDSGVYYIGVSASGNDQYDPVKPGTGYGGTTQGRYDLRLTFRAQTDSSDSIQDVAGPGGVSVALDGDADGTPGGVFNFWFETRAKDRSFQFNAGGSPALEGQTMTLTGANGTVRRFEFSADATVATGNVRIPYTNSSTEAQLALAVASAINARTELGITASAAGRSVTIRGERTLQFSQNLNAIDVMGKTIFVDKTAGPNADGTLAKPFNNIAGTGVANAFAATFPGDIVRIVGNGGADGKLETVGDNLAYEIGYGLLAGSTLSDGVTMDVPMGVTVMVDAGAIFKSNRARIGIGSSTLGVDRSGGALQVLGAPVLLDAQGNAIRTNDGNLAPGSVFFTSWLDESIGQDNYAPTTSPAAGNWGGIAFKRDLDKSAGRFDLEDEGIFLQYINHADIRYGGSSAVVIDSTQTTVNAIQIVDMRPTITNNRISNSADAAISATPDSFLETLFSEPLYQRKGLFTPDYDRVGPDIHNNILVNNSINGLFIKVSTPVGGDTRQLTVPGRFDDTDIVHVVSENIIIQGRPGAGVLDTTFVSANLVSLQARIGGDLLPGTYNYKISYVDQYGFETPPSAPTQNVVVAPGQSSVAIFGIPGASGEYVGRRIYRSDSTGGGSYRLVAELDGGTNSFTDRGGSIASETAFLFRDRPNVAGIALSTTAGGTLPANVYTYRIVMVDSFGRESLASENTVSIATTPNSSILLSNIPGVQESYSARRIYRSLPGAIDRFVLVTELSNPATSSYLDNGSAIGTPLSIETSGNIRPRLDASLVIDPGTIIKLEGTRIEVGHSAQLIAEGTSNGRVVFTSKQDDRYGAGGTFDTNNNGLRGDQDSQPRDWSGIYASPGSNLSIDNSVIAYAGGVSRIEGTFKAFSPIELQQANGRIANTVFEENANGIGGQGPIDRLGRPANENYPLGNNNSRGSTVFVRGTQPIFLNNIFQNNSGTAITIDANSMDAELRGDVGRQTGSIDRNVDLDANRGPLFRGNKMFNNGINGLEIRGDATTNNRSEDILSIRDVTRNVLTTESVWDDTDIVHVLFDSIVVSNLEHGAGLRLQSAINESLVIKMEGQGSNFDKERGTGFTATGEYTSSADRKGGTIQIIGQPGFPVVFTSLRDDSVGAGTQPDGRPQTDTNNDGIATVPRPGDWRSLLFDTFSNDRNVQTVMEVESPTISAPGVNDNVGMAQHIGHLAANAQASDEIRRLGFIVQGVISEPNDQDVYSITATAGTEVWFDVDNTDYNLDTVIEILDASGALLARSDNSLDEQLNPDLITVSPLVDRTAVNPLVKRSADVARKNTSGIVKDDFSQNPADAGLRIRLPGIAGTLSTYFFRVRSKSLDIENSGAGLTSGAYSVQVRIQDQQEFAGSVVTYADIRFATNGVHATGLPSRSPLTGEAHVNMFDGTIDAITNVGNLHYTDLGAISVAGELANSNNTIRFSLGDTNLLNTSNSGLYPIVVDVDYADGLNRPNTIAYLVTPDGTYVGADSRIADDIVNPIAPLSGSELADLSRGSVGARDPFIGTIALPRGTYDLVIGGQGNLPAGQARNNVIFSDSLEGNSTFFDTANINNRLNTDPDFKWAFGTSAAGAHSGTRVIGWSPDAGKPNTVSSPDLLNSRTFSLPNNSTINDRVLFSMRYRYLGDPADEVTVRVFNTQTPNSTLYSGVLKAGSTEWQMFGDDLTAELMAAPGATYQFEFGFRDSDGNVVAGTAGVEFDDFFLGTSATPVSPINTYRKAVNETFDTGLVSSANNSRIFADLPMTRELNRWQVADVGTAPGQSGLNVLEYRSADNAGVKTLTSEIIDLSAEDGSSKLYFSYDFTPRDTGDRVDIFAKVVGGGTRLIASTVNEPNAIHLTATNGTYRQVSMALGSLDAQQIQLEFVYTSGGPAAAADAPAHIRIDNIMIGMASRGEFIAGLNSTAGLPTVSASGQYQVEIRKSDALPVGKELESYDRGSVSTSIHFAQGISMPDKSSFILSDGASQIRFQFTYDNTFDFGSTPIRITATSSAASIATAVRDAINTMYSQNRLRISATSSNGAVAGTPSNSTLLVLTGEVNVVSGGDLFTKDGISGIKNFSKFGDLNVPREQGQFIVTSTTVTDARDFGIWSAPADKYYADGRAASTQYGPPPTLGGAYARNLPQENLLGFGVTPGSRAEDAGLAPGMVITNNILNGNGLGGIHIQGDTPLWRLTVTAGTEDNAQNANNPQEIDHAGTRFHDTDILSINFGRQRVNFEFEDVSGAPTGGPAYGSGVVQGNGWNANNIPIYYREDGGQAYQRPSDGVSGYADDEMVKTIRDSIVGSVLTTNLTSLNVSTWVDSQVEGTASFFVKGPQSITYHDRFGGSGPMSIVQIGEYTAAPFVRAVNNTVFGNDGRAPFSASKIDDSANDIISGAIETWQGTGTNPVEYTIDATLNADPLSTGSSDVDFYKFSMEIGERVLVNVAPRGESTLDAILKIFDSNGREIDLNSPTDLTQVDYTATSPGVYYAAVSAAGNNGYDPQSLSARRRGPTSGDYSMSLQVLKPQQFVISVDDVSAYADGETFTIEQVADFGDGTRSRTFEFTRTGAVTAGNIPIHIAANYRVPDVARAIAGAISLAGMNNVQNIPNERFGSANPLAPVSAIAVGGMNGIRPGAGVPVNSPDVGINSGNARGAQVHPGIIIRPNWSNDESPFDAGSHSSPGIGHNLTQSVQLSNTSLGNGTTEKYVVVRNASIIRGNGNIKVDPDYDANNNLNQIMAESGILVSGGASPTLLNNVFVNVQTPIVQEENITSSGVGRPGQARPSPTVVSGTISQYHETRSAQAKLNVTIENSPINIPNTSLDFNIIVPDNVKVFVDAPGGKFLPAPNSPLIDSSIDSIPERETYRAIKQAVGISTSPVIAPDRDHSGQLRADDPTVTSPNGLGGNVFKDRGALDRADFIGPKAVAITPVDNDAQGNDIDNTESVMRLKEGNYNEFRIQLKDGFETANLQAGTGIDDDSVVGREGGNRQPGSVITLTENGRLLVEGIDYAFSYIASTNEIVLKPLAGVWRNDRVYDISLNNKDRFVIETAAGDLINDGDTIQIRDSLGGTVYFEYDSGFRLQIPQGLQLLVPIAGGGAGGVADGDQFIVNNRSESFVFEFDSNNNIIAGNNRIPFTALSTKLDIANAIEQALRSIPDLHVKVLDNSDIFIGAPQGSYVDTSDVPAMNQPNSTLALLVPAEGTRPGGVTDGQTLGISDGRNSYVFEFDADRNTASGNIRIDISLANTANEVAQAIVNAIALSDLGIQATIVDGTKVHLALPTSGSVNANNTNVTTVGVSRAVVDGQTIQISREIGDTIHTQTFEFTSDGVTAEGNLPVLISNADTQSDLGQKLADAIAASDLELLPRHVGDGNLYVGGDESYSISVDQAPSVGLFGRPGIKGSSTLEIYGTLLLQLPTRGGVDIEDNSTFTITQDGITATFEFDSNFSGASAPGNIVIQYGTATTAADLVTTMIPLLRNSALALEARDAGGGRIDIGLLPNNAVNTGNSGISLDRGSVSDGDVFVINNGTTSVTFEFENLSIGDGRNLDHTPIRYNNQSTNASIYAAMKAAIESSVLGLTTVITEDGLRLLDNPRFTTNIDNAPSLHLSGVPGGANSISFVQDQSFTDQDMRDAIVRAINQANAAGRTNLTAKPRGGATLFVENAINISENVANFYLRGIQDVTGNFLRSNRINNETQFTILMPGTELDFGDAPDPHTTTNGRYPTLLNSDGARHVSNATALRLGTEINSEIDARTSPIADGDQGDDGVVFQFQNLSEPVFNHTIDTEITVSLTTKGFVDAWIDFNGDGDWDDPGEQIIKSAEFTSDELTRTFTVRVPSTFPIPASGLDSFARFRASSSGNLLPTGLALDGEVEDYAVRILPGVAPVPVSDSYSVSEDDATGINTTDITGTATPGFAVDDSVLANDANASGMPIFAKLVTPPEHAVGTFTLSDKGLFTYRPQPNFYGTDTFVYRAYIVVDASRGEIIESATDTTVTINVRPVNDAPTASNFTLTIDEHETLRISTSEIIVYGSATTGPANEADQTLTLSVPNSVSTRGGSVSVVADELIYTPATGFSGQDTFEYRLTDNGFTGNLSDPRSVTRTVTINVVDTNDAPTTTPKSITVVEDTPFTRANTFYMAGDSAVEPGQTLALTRVDALSANGGTVVIQGNNIVYTPRQDYNGPDTFYYYVTDNDATNPRTTRGTVNVTVTAVNDAPRVLEPLGTLNFQEDGQERIIDLTQHFFDADSEFGDEELTYRVASNTNPNLVIINFNGDEAFIRPRPDANGTATIVIEARDSTGATITNTLTVVVEPVADAPRLVSPMPNLTVREDDPISPIVLTPNYFMDPDTGVNGDELRFTVDVSNEDLVLANIVSGRLQLTLLPDASGTASITVTAFDLAGNAVSDSFDLTVTSVNDGPISVDDVYYVQRGSLFVTTDIVGNSTATLNDNGVLANDHDPESNAFTARVTRQPSHGSLTLNPNGTFSYRSNTTVPVGTVDTFEYESVDEFGAVGNRATVRINIGQPAPSPHQNPMNRLDVTADGFISPIDVLYIVNHLNFSGSPITPVSELPPPPAYMDVNGDMFVTPIDALEVINYLNARGNMAQGEGESAPATSNLVGQVTVLTPDRVDAEEPILVGAEIADPTAVSWSGLVGRTEHNEIKLLDNQVEQNQTENGLELESDIFAFYTYDNQQEVDGIDELLSSDEHTGSDSESLVDDLFTNWSLD